MINEELQSFIEDAAERLDECNRAVLRLDEIVSAGSGDAEDAINVLFRAMHTIKGNAGIVGIPPVVSLAHVLESAMDRFRTQRLEISRTRVDTVFAGLDALQELMILLQQGRESTFNLQGALSELERDFAPQAKERHGDGRATDRFPGWTLVDCPDQTELLEQVDVGERNLFILTCSSLDLPPLDPLSDLRFERLTMMGHVLAQRRPGEGKFQIAYASKGDLKMIEGCFPPGFCTCEPWCNDDVEGTDREQAADDRIQSQAPGEEKPLASDPAETSIRVGIALLDKLMDLVGELVLNRNQILQHVRNGQDQGIVAPVQRLNLITSELQEAVMKTRMQPIRGVWDKFPRVVRDYCRTSGKLIAIEMDGAETELDRSLLEIVKDPLTHILRNSIDHGIELPEARVAAGKKPQGTIRLLAHHDGGQIIMEISDDGRGLDIARIKAKAQAQGLVAPEVLGEMSEAELSQLIFHPGFSTADKISDLSGRGVGMDVVQTNIERIGGTVEVQSTHGQGTVIKLRVPLTLAVLPALIIHVGSERFAIPQSSLLEVVRTGQQGLQRIEHVRESLVFRLRESLIPVVSLRSVLGLSQVDAGLLEEEAVNLIILSSDNCIFGLAVDAIGDTEEIVVKPLHRFFQSFEVFGGVTILGDGRACMILDVNGLASRGGLKRSGLGDVEPEPRSRTEREDFQQMLLCRVGAERTHAIPMALVTRLEEFPVAKIEQVGRRRVIQYDGGLLPIFDFTGLLNLPPIELTDRVQVVVAGEGDRRVGLLVTEIQDIVEDHMAIHPVPGTPGVLGAAVIGGVTTEVLDIHAAIQREQPDWFKVNSAADSSPTVLLVEDSRFFREILRTHVEGQGYRVIEAEDGEAALEALAAHSVDVVLSDIEMPRMNGLAMVRRIREDPALKHLPCIALSSVSSAEDQEIGLRAGFDGYLPKYDRHSVLEAIVSFQKRKAPR